MYIRLDRQREKIAAMKRTILETEGSSIEEIYLINMDGLTLCYSNAYSDVGVTILEELGRNREKIVSVTDKTKEFTSEMEAAGRITSSITMRNALECVIS
jgi:hypothetical protein